MALLFKESNDLLNAYHFHQYQSTPKINFINLIDHHESAAKILFNAVNWTKTIPAFTSLSNRDQVYIHQINIFLLSIFFFSFVYLKKVGVIYLF